LTVAWPWRGTSTASAPTANGRGTLMTCGNLYLHVLGVKGGHPGNDDGSAHGPCETETRLRMRPASPQQGDGRPGAARTRRQRGWRFPPGQPAGSEGNLLGRIPSANDAATKRAPNLRRRQGPLRRLRRPSPRTVPRSTSTTALPGRRNGWRACPDIGRAPVPPLVRDGPHQQTPPSAQQANSR